MGSYTPDPRPRLQRATRFFARLISFDLECPHCGDVYSIRSGRRRQAAERDPNWDPSTGRFRCTNKQCGRNYVLGILAWPIGRGAGTATITPTDQVPSPRQLAGLRKEGGGWWMAEEDRQRWAKPEVTNLTTEDDRPEPEDEEDL